MGNHESAVMALLTRSFILAALYIAVSALAFYMVCWVLIFPSSWLVGNELHDKLVNQVLTAFPAAEPIDMSRSVRHLTPWKMLAALCQPRETSFSNTKCIQLCS